MNRLAFEATQSKEPCYVLKLKGKKKEKGANICPTTCCGQINFNHYKESALL